MSPRFVETGIVAMVEMPVTAQVKAFFAVEVTVVFAAGLKVPARRPFHVMTALIVSVMLGRNRDGQEHHCKEYK